jgi:hypothetical protein
VRLNFESLLKKKINQVTEIESSFFGLWDKNSISEENTEKRTGNKSGIAFENKNKIFSSSRFLPIFNQSCLFKLTQWQNCQVLHLF